MTTEKELKPFPEYNDTEIMTTIYSWLSKNQILFLEEYFNKCYHQGRKQALEDVKKLIDYIFNNYSMESPESIKANLLERLNKLENTNGI